MFRFVKIRGFDVWGLVIENLEQLTEYARVVAYPKSVLVTNRLLERIEHNKKQKYPVSGHWGDKLTIIADLEIQNREDITVMEMKAFITSVMVDPKQMVIENGHSLVTNGFPFSIFTDDLEIMEEKILDTIPVEFVDYYKTKDYFGILFNV
jgi:hypothetical protein